MLKIIENITLKRVNFYLLHVLVFLLSFQERIIPMTLVLFLFINLFAFSWEDRMYYFQKRKKYILAFIAYYVMSIIGMMYTLNVSEGLFDLEVKLSILLVPIFLLTSNVIHRYTVFGLIKTFLFGVSLAMVIQFILATINYQTTGNWDVYYYNLLSYFHHPAYFSMYTNFAIASLMVFIFHYRERIQFRHFFLLGFLVIGVYQLSSRNGLLTLAVLITYAFIHIIFPKLKWKKMLLAFFVTILVSAGVLYPIAKYTKSIRTVEVNTEKSSSGVRLAMWKVTMPVVLDNFWWGVGTGDVNRELQTEFAKNKIVRAVRDGLNVHNQFLQTQVSLGIFGTLILILAIVYPFYVSVKKGKLFFPLFAVILVINFLTESVLNTQAGVIYYAVLNGILFFTYEE
tara:strand:- start:117944 stop:119137 length:1194 start_codon:yes stop_codon:yes gene_type:complete